MTGSAGNNWNPKSANPISRKFLMFDHDITKEDFGFNPMFDEESHVCGNLLSMNQNTVIELESMKPHSEMKYNSSLKTTSDVTRYELGTLFEVKISESLEMNLHKISESQLSKLMD